MAITQETHWDNVGIEPGAGDAEYTAGQQPISEHDDWFNWSAAKDVENLIAALENVTTGHDHDGVNSKKVDGSDVVNTPAGNVVATDVQAAIDELDTEKLAEALFNANTIVKADSDDAPAVLTVAEQTLVGRITAGVITALTAAQVRTLLNVENGADVTDATNVDAAGAAMNADKDVANGIAGLDASSKLTRSTLPLPMLDETAFRANAATGTATNPSRFNDNALVNPGWFSNIGDYGEVQFDYGMFVNEIRQYGENGNEENGSFKMQFWDNVAWLDVSANFATVKTGWGAWISLSHPVYTTALRIVAVTIDSHYGLNRNDLVELQARG